MQERGLSFAQPFDSRYETVFSANDPGETPRLGSLRYARYGRGTYAYVGLALFRQLPAGVPGAYRLLANLVSASPGPDDGTQGGRRSRAEQDPAPGCGRR